MIEDKAVTNKDKAIELFITAQKQARSCEAKTAGGELNGNKFILTLTEQGWLTDITMRDGFHTVVPVTQMARAIRLVAS